MFDIRKGKELSTYFKSWIKILGTSAAEDLRMVHLPEHLCDALRYMKRKPGCSDKDILAHNSKLSTRTLTKIRSGDYITGNALYYDTPVNGVHVGNYDSIKR